MLWVTETPNKTPGIITHSSVCCCHRCCSSGSQSSHQLQTLGTALAAPGKLPPEFVRAARPRSQPATPDPFKHCTRIPNNAAFTSHFHLRSSTQLVSKIGWINLVYVNMWGGLKIQGRSVCLMHSTTHHLHTGYNTLSKLWEGRIRHHQHRAKNYNITTRFRGFFLTHISQQAKKSKCIMTFQVHFSGQTGTVGAVWTALIRIATNLY